MKDLFQSAMLKIIAVAMTSAITVLLGVYFIVEMSIGTLNSRVTDLVGSYGQASEEISKLREDAGYIKGQVDALIRSNDYETKLAKLERSIISQFSAIDLAMSQFQSQLRDSLTTIQSSENLNMYGLIEVMAENLKITEEVQISLSALRIEFIEALRNADRVHERLSLLADMGATSAFDEELANYTTSLVEISESLKDITSGLTSIAVP